MPLFEQTENQTISEKNKDGMAKLFKEYPFEDFEAIQNGFWVFGIFNERVVGAMFLEKINEQEHIAHYLAVRKPTQNRGIGRELLNRWTSINKCKIKFSEKLSLILGDFK